MMKRYFIKSLVIAGLVLIGNIAYAGDLEHDGSKVTVNKLKSDDATGRALGGALARANQHTDDSTPANADKKRIQELEDLVKQQQKLIELYKKQSKQP